MVENTRTTVNRRTFLTGSGILAGAFAAGALTSCATSASPPSGGSTTAAGEVTADNPFGVQNSGTAEIVVPVTGYGTEYVEANGAQLNEIYPDIELNIHAVQDMKTTMQARFVQGDVPDWVAPMQLDIPGLAAQGQLADLTEFYDSEAPGFDGKSVKDVLLPGVYDAGILNGSPLTYNYTYMVQGIWYSKKLFDEQGWEEPATVDDFMALSEEIKAAGMAPMAYQGQYPGYLVWHLAVMAGREGGQEVIEAIHNLEEGAWHHPAVLEAARFFEQMRANGNFLEGTEGLDHTQSQTYWAQGKAAFIPCGGWLEVEMGDIIPADTQMTIMSAPAISENGALSRGAIVAQPGSSFFVPEAAKNKAVGMEFMRQLASKEAARRFTELNGSMVAMRDYLEPGTQISPGFDTQVELVNAAGDDVIQWELENINARMVPDIDGITGELARGALTAEQFCERAQEIADGYAAEVG